VDPTKAFSLWTPDQGVPPMDPDEGPCPIDPRKERSAPATPDQGVPPVDPDQPSPDWMRPHPGWRSMTRRHRSGSENRKRTKILTARVDPEESRIIKEKAKAAGGVSALFRIAVLGYKLPKSKVDTQAVAKLLAELGKIGSNVNQIAKHLNAGRPGDTVENMLTETLRDLLEMRGVCMRALGLEPNRKIKD
jgi:hypothetical protein